MSADFVSFCFAPSLPILLFFVVKVSYLIMPPGQLCITLPAVHEGPECSLQDPYTHRCKICQGYAITCHHMLRDSYSFY